MVMLGRCGLHFGTLLWSLGSRFVIFIVLLIWDNVVAPKLFVTPFFISRIFNCPQINDTRSILLSHIRPSVVILLSLLFSGNFDSGHVKTSHVQMIRLIVHARIQRVCRQMAVVVKEYGPRIRI
jgi:hypothetical protein